MSTHLLPFNILKVEYVNYPDLDSSDRAGSDQEISPSTGNQNHQQASRSTTDYEEHRQYGMPITSLSTALSGQPATHTSDFAYNVQPRLERAPIKQAGRVACIGESANLSLLASDVVHYPLPDSVKGPRARLADLDDLEMNILTKRGAFLLPPRGLCDELVVCFFQWVAPIIPVVNRVQFMKRYHDSTNPPSILLLQAMLLAGSRVCTNPQLMDVNGSTTPAAITFYRRAKALYDANYEDDRVSIVQSLVLMSWYWEGPEGNSPTYLLLLVGEVLTTFEMSPKTCFIGLRLQSLLHRAQACTGGEFEHRLNTS